ncbi:MAG: GIY-YIG nuclease family protein [Ignavibacteria bacterium]|nr:GIY-YIG nuclease family protein [Ignavibacteria bacterium]
MFCTYILESSKTGEFYIGQTNNIQSRIAQHNSGLSKATKHGMPWKLIYVESFITRSEAIRRERYLKRLKSRKANKKTLKEFV